MTPLLTKIDKLLCSYLGISTEEILPQEVVIKDEGLLISSTQSFRHYLHTETWDAFLENHINTLNATNKEKLGKAIGQSVARNLIISFDDITLHRKSKNA